MKIILKFVIIILKYSNIFFKIVEKIFIWEKFKNEKFK